jgi:hypothetical protein
MAVQGLCAGAAPENPSAIQEGRGTRACGFTNRDRAPLLKMEDLRPCWWRAFGIHGADSQLPVARGFFREQYPLLT